MALNESCHLILWPAGDVWPLELCGRWVGVLQTQGLVLVRSSFFLGLRESPRLDCSPASESYSSLLYLVPSSHHHLCHPSYWMHEG